MDISIKLDDKEVQKKLKSLSTGISSFRTPLSAIGDDLLGYYGQNVFESQGRALGEPWRELSAATLKARANRTGYYAKPPKVKGKILIWTGRLQAGFKKKAERLKLTINNKVPYFKYHQIGRRPMLGITSEVITKIVTGLNDHIKKLLK